MSHKTKTQKKGKNLLKKAGSSSGLGSPKAKLLLFVMLFGVVGGSFVFKSFALTSTGCKLTATPKTIDDKTYSNISLTITNKSGRRFTNMDSLNKIQKFFVGTTAQSPTKSSINYIFFEPLANGETKTYSLGSQGLPSNYSKVNLAVVHKNPDFRCSTNITH